MLPSCLVLFIIDSANAGRRPAFKVNSMFRTLFFSLLLLISPVWAAGFGINTTRLIYPQGAKSISAELRNTQKNEPLLVQIGISDSPDIRSQSPFIVTPPVFRIEPQSVNQVRIALPINLLPSDKESVFYFHATAITAKNGPVHSYQENNIQANISFGVGSVIKLFYRPSGLRGSPAEAQKGLQFSRVDAGLQVINPSSYFVSFAKIQVGEKSLPFNSPTSMMLAPGGRFTWRVSTNLKAGSLMKWQTINDSGGIDEYSAVLP